MTEPVSKQATDSNSTAVKIILFILFAFVCVACSGNSDEQNQLMRAKKIEALKKDCKPNERIEVWKVKSVTDISGGAKQVDLTSLDGSDEANIFVEGFDNLKPDMEVIVKISVNDLSLNQKYGPGVAAREFVTIVDYY